MVIAPCTLNEDERIRTLDEYGIMDTDKETVFDDITHVAASICDTPIALVSLIDHRRQWFKSKVGLSVDETHRDIAFCTHAILQDDVFEIEDATKDERFFDNPLVTSDPNIRFYAGVPLVAHNDAKLGTLCVISDKPHKLNDEQKRLLKVLAKSVVSLLNIKRQSTSLQNANSVQKRLIEALEQSNRELDTFAYSISQDFKSPLQEISTHLNHLGSDPSTLLSPRSLETLHSSDRSILGMQQMIDELLEFARMRVSHDYPETMQLRELVRILKVHIHWPKNFELDVQDIDVSLPKIPFSTVLANLLSNSFHHHHKSEGKTTVLISERQHHYILRVIDDGPGIPEHVKNTVFNMFTTQDSRNRDGIGLATVQRIVEHYKGGIEIISDGKTGTEVKVCWPK